MRGKREYCITFKLVNGEEATTNYWSSNKKGSSENFIDGLETLKKVHNLKTEDFVKGEYEISYAMTSLSRR